MPRGSARAVIVAVNANAWKNTLEFVDSARHLNRFPEVEFVIVDNASTDSSLPRIRDAIAGLANVHLLESKNNRGYFGGACWGFTKYLEQGRAMPDWAVICNNDILFEDKEFFDKLLTYDFRTVGVLAPRILSSQTGLDLNPNLAVRPGRNHLRKLWLCFSSYYVAVLTTTLSRWKRRWKAIAHGRRRLAAPRATRIYSPHGSFIVFSRTFFDRGGSLESDIFLYCEEILVAEQCRRIGVDVVYDPSLCVKHNEHQSTGNYMTRFKYQCWKNSLAYIASTYWNDLC